MALSILRGPAGSGKSQEMRERGDTLIVDLTALWAALRGFERGEDGTYPIREDGDPALPLALWTLPATSLPPTGFLAILEV